ncbi:hypothetical protein AWB67_06624 [Caballeronia terrestris]|uniref:Uncharacterized protein n=1 Tax=Caballeronia terrestris TaxID=1226301 RepID=A0A158KT14_9BURK|nr:hypothetical protein AWB67_06624 [Caballeronia terrestris]
MAIIVATYILFGGGMAIALAIGIWEIWNVREFAFGAARRMRCSRANALLVTILPTNRQVRIVRHLADPRIRRSCSTHSSSLHYVHIRHSEDHSRNAGNPRSCARRHRRRVRGHWHEPANRADKDGRWTHRLHSLDRRHDERNNKRFEEHDATPVQPDETRRRATSRIEPARRSNHRTNGACC